jgi:hypothetical protein
VTAIHFNVIVQGINFGTQSHDGFSVHGDQPVSDIFFSFPSAFLLDEIPDPAMIFCKRTIWVSEAIIIPTQLLRVVWS